MPRLLRRMTRTRSVMTTILLLVGSFIASEEGAMEVAALQNSCSVTLPAGDVQGVDFGASCAFLGIPYAASPADNNRWKPPQPPAVWGPSILYATTPPATCTASEDCLKLNVWVSDPLPTGTAPVIVWLHTGAFVAASANFPGTNGARLAQETGGTQMSR